MFMRIINVRSISNWGKIVVKDVSFFTRVSDCIFTMRECSTYSWYDIQIWHITIDLMPFHLFFELFRLETKYFSWQFCLLLFKRVDIKFLWFLYFKWSSALIVGSFFLMKSDRNLFFTEIDFCKPGVIQGFDLNFNLYLLIFLKGAKLSNNSLILFKNISVE